MGGLSIFFEEHGLATTGISLIRLHTERTAPPRALWVPFELGRPLGVPGDAAFQKRVMSAALGLLEAERGPVLMDYAEDAPEIDFDAAQMNGMVCPVDFPQPPDGSAPASEHGRALMKEIASLAPWYELAVRTRGRTTVGPSGLTIEGAGKFLSAFIDDPSVAAPAGGMSAPALLKLAFEDIKAYYGEAVTAQPGAHSGKQVQHWLFNDTVLGKMLWNLRDICRASDDAYCQFLGRNSIIPDEQINPSL